MGEHSTVIALHDWPGPGSCRSWFCSSEQATLSPWASASPGWSLDHVHPWTILGELVRTGIPERYPRPQVRVLGARPAMLHF